MLFWISLERKTLETITRGFVWECRANGLYPILCVFNPFQAHIKSGDILCDFLLRRIPGQKSSQLEERMSTNPSTHIDTASPETSLAQVFQCALRAECNCVWLSKMVEIQQDCQRLNFSLQKREKALKELIITMALVSQNDAVFYSENFEVRNTVISHRTLSR